MEENAQQQNSAGGLGKIICTIAIAAGIYFAFSSLFGSCSGGNKDGVEGKNFKYYSKSDNTVYGYVVCPECKHVGDMVSARISAGEDASSTQICEQCYEIFESYVKRLD